MSQTPAPSRNLGVTILALVWVVGSLIYFFSQPLLSHPPVSRIEFWKSAPLILSDLLPGAAVTDEISSGWQFFPQRFDLLSFAGLILWGAWGLGGLILRSAKLLEDTSSLERNLLAIASGLSLLSLLVLCFGLAGILSRVVFLSLLIVPAIVETILCYKQRSPYAKSGKRVFLPFDRAGFVFISGCFLLVMLFGAMLPPTDFDVKEYHLEGPKEWFQAGEISLLSHNVYTSFPFLTEMLSLLGMIVHGDWYRGALVGKVVLMSFAPLTAGALFCLGRRWFSEKAGWFAAILYLSTPWVYRISIIAYTEGAMLGYLACALLASDIARKKTSNGLSNRDWGLVGFFAGSAMACKYPGLISVVVPIGTLSGWSLYRSLKVNQSSTLLKDWMKAAGCFALGVIVAVGPWLLKNFAQTGNPVYPLAYSVFGGSDWNAELEQKWQDAHSPPGHDLSRLLPDLNSVFATSDYQSPLLLAFAPLALLLVKSKREVWGLLLLTVWLLATWWWLTHRIDRFWLPVLPGLCLLAAAGLESLSLRTSKFITGGVLMIAILFNFALVVSVRAGLNTYLADLDALSNSPIVQPLGIRYLNETLKPSEKALLVGEANVFDARVPLAYNTVFDESLLERWSAERVPDSDPPEWKFFSAEQIRNNLSEQGITHVLVNWSEILRYRQTYRYTDFALPGKLDTLIELGVLSQPQPLSWKPLAEYSEHERIELEQNFPARIKTIQGEKSLITQEVYRVLEHK